MKLKTISVSKLNEYIKRVLQTDPILQNVLVEGEISNLTLHSSGHAYFALKDAGGKVSAVMFRSSVGRLSKRPMNGDRVIIRGRIGVYEKTGQYQLYADEMIYDGSGNLHLAFEKLKEELSKLGYFDESTKKIIPSSPQRIGLITSPTGAAVRDVLSVLERRTSLPEVILFPVHVQGEYAVGDIKRAFEYFEKNPVDTIILTRGGGSIEELWAFNEREVADVIYQCQTPVISGVGHETDFTISDFVADMRVPTPSAAAECVTQGDYEKRLIMEQQYEKMTRLMNFRMNQTYLALERASVKNLEQKVHLALTQYRYDVEQIKDHLYDCVNEKKRSTENELNSVADKLEYLSPLNIIRRGYGLLSDEDGNTLTSVDDINENDIIGITLKDGKAKARVLEKERSNG